MDRLELKASFTTDDTGRVEGKAWDFRTPDKVGDDIEPAAFAGAIGKALPMLFAHDQAQAVGIWEDVVVEEEGLRVTGKLLVDDVARAKEVRALVRAGAVTGLSIGFVTKKAAPRKGGGRTVSGLDLVEISLVAVPAHPAARITTIKELPMPTENTELASVELKLADTESKLAAAETKAAAAVDALKTRIDGLETKINRPAVHTDKTEPSVERKAFAQYLRVGDKALRDFDAKTLNVGTNPQGGYLAPTEMTTEMVKNLVEFSPLRSIASVRQTSAPDTDYLRRTAITNAAWAAELQDSTASEPAFGTGNIVNHELKTHVDISNKLLQDAVVDVEGEVRMALAEDFGKKEGVAFITGNGVGKPEGILANASVGNVVNGHATNISTDKLIDLMYSLAAYYRNRGTWLMNGTTLAAVRKLKDGQGNYLWQPAYTAGQPESILGRPVLEDVEMPNIADGAFPIVFGDFESAYRIVDRIELNVLVNPYLLATAGITRFHAQRRVGGAVIRAEAIKKLKTATS